MKILILTTRLNLGGIGIYTSSLASSIRRRGNDVVVASSGGRLIERIKRDGIEHISIPVDTSADIGLHTLAAYLKLSGIIKERGIQIIHAQTRVTQVIAHLLSRKRNVPFVSTCHGFFKSRGFRKFLPCWGECVIAISDAVREHLVNDMGVSKEKIRVIYNGIDTERFNRRFSEDERLHIRKEYGLREPVTIGMISRLSDVKGHRYLFEAFAKVLKEFPRIQLLVVGDGPSDYLNGLKSLAHDLGIEDKVIFHSACEDTSIPLSVIDIFCMPSLQEGLGLAILEAMARGLPVVASDVGGIYTLIRHRQNGLLVPPRDGDALADAISEILENSSMAEGMGRLSQRLVVEKFSLDAMTDNVLSLYKEVLDEA